MTEEFPTDNRTPKEKVLDFLKETLTKEKRIGPFPSNQIHILAKIVLGSDNGVPNDEIMEDTRLLASLVSKINERVLSKMGLKIRGVVRYTMVRIEDEEDK